MLFATMGQGALWVWMMASGAAMYILYLLISGARRLTAAGFVLTLLADLLFGVLCAAVFIAFLVAGNYGRVRLFEIIAAASGFLVCTLALGPALKRAKSGLGRAAKRIWKGLSDNRLIKVIFR